MSDINNTAIIGEHLNDVEESNPEYKMDIEEASLNNDYVKREPKEEVWDYEGKYMKSLKEENNETKLDIKEPNLINFLGDIKGPSQIKVIFDNNYSEDRTVFEDNSYCNECSADYKGFCLKCSILTHILNNNIPPTNYEWKVKTISSQILEIRDILDEKRVYALKNLPENVILGPFEGISPIERSVEFIWGIKNGQLSNLQNGNWMQYINCAASASTNNLHVFQFEGNLYYQTNREIGEGEELLVYYREEEIQILDNNEDDCFIPTSVIESQKVFACTRCCLGFKLEEGLIRHKHKCPHRMQNVNISEIIQCYYCNIWLEKEDYLGHHVSFCRDNNSSQLLPGSQFSPFPHPFLKEKVRPDN